MNVLYKERVPSGEEFMGLIDSAGWTGITDYGPLKLKDALLNSWHVVTAYEEDKPVGIGRILSDGIVQALICDLIVLPEYQGRGIGAGILKQLLQKCKDNEILLVQLFAARGKDGFYKKFGFEERPADSPGMRWVNRELEY